MAAVRGMFEDVDFTAMSLDERTFTSLNSTYLAYGIAVGAILVLLVAVGLYLYDYYYGTSWTDPVEGNFEYNQYYTDADAYQQALYEYQQAQAQYQSRYYFLKKKFTYLLQPIPSDHSSEINLWDLRSRKCYCEILHDLLSFHLVL